MANHQPSKQRGFLDNLRTSSNSLFNRSQTEEGPELLHLDNDLEDSAHQGFQHDRQGTQPPILQHQQHPIYVFHALYISLIQIVME